MTEGKSIVRSVRTRRVKITTMPRATMIPRRQRWGFLGLGFGGVGGEFSGGLGWVIGRLRKGPGRVPDAVVLERRVDRSGRREFLGGEPLEGSNARGGRGIFEINIVFADEACVELGAAGDATHDFIDGCG